MAGGRYGLHALHELCGRRARGKFVITTDGAPAWKEFFKTHPDNGVYLNGYRDGNEETRIRLLTDALQRFVD